MNWLNAFGETVQTQPEALRGFGVAKDMEPTKPSAFQGTGDALEKALPFSFYQSLSGVNELMADRVEVNYGLDNNEDAFSDFKPTQEQKEQVADRLRQDAKFARLKAQNDYTPNPETTGQAAMMIHGLTGSLAKAIGYTVATGGSGILAAPLFGADLGLYEAGKLRDKGVDASTARTAGAITGTVNAVGMALPGAVGTSYVKSMLFGGAVNPLTDISEQASIKFVLDNANYSKQAQEYDPFDPVNLGVSAGMGIAFGALGARANRAQARYEAAEAAAQPSAPQTPEGQTAPAANMNKSVLDSIQNRDRSSKESRLQMEKIAAAPNFNLLRESRSLDQGAPIIAYVPEDMNILWGKRVDVSADPSSEPMTMRYAVVDADDVLTSNAVDGSSNPGFTDPTVSGARAIAGNGRIAGLQGAYRQVKATKYRADLTQDSKEFGISKRQIKKMKNPILVRVMDDADVVEGIGEASNRTGTLKLNPAEQAAQDARNVRLEEVELTKDGEITQKSMDEFVKRTPDKEGLIDSSGNALYDNIARRMRPAIFAAAFSDTRIINRFIANSPEDQKIMNVLQSVATEVVRLKKIKGELDFSPDPLEAVADVFETRKEAKKINGKGHEKELTGSLMEESATPAQRYFRDILLSANPERLQEILARFREVAEQESGGAGFFEAVTKDQVFETVKSEFDQRDAAINSIKPSDVDAAMELQSANVIQNDQPTGTRGDVNKSLADERRAAEQLDNGEKVEVSGEGVDLEVMDKEVSDFITRFVKELVGAGAEKKVAELGAKVLDAFYETLGIRLGKSRKELEQEYSLRVQRGEDQANTEGALLQSQIVDPLITVHNISEANLNKSLDLGGFAVPSLGITKQRTPYADFGEISLIGTRDMVDPSRGTPVFSQDAYTARFPQPDWSKSLNTEKAKPLVKEIMEAKKEVNENGPSGYYYLQYEGDRDKAIKDLLTHASGMYLFIKHKGIPFTPIKQQAKKPSFAAGIVSDFVDNNGLDVSTVEEGSAAHKKISDGVVEALREKLNEPTGLKGLRMRAYGDNIDAYEKTGFIPFKLIEEVKKYEVERKKAEGGDAPVSSGATQLELEKLIAPMRDEFEKFISDKVNSVYSAPLIKVGNSYRPITLQNVVEAMKSSAVSNKESTLFFGPGKVRAAAARRFDSIEDIQGNRDLIADSQTVNGINAAANDKMSDFRDLAARENRGDEFSTPDRAMEALAKVAGQKSKPTPARMKSALKKYGFEPSDETVKLGVEILNDIKKAMTDYFEAKPQRAVGADEFRGAVVPEGTSEATIRRLERAGITVAKYDAEVEGARAKVIQELTNRLNEKSGDILFQNENAPRGIYTPGERVITLMQSANESTFIHESGHYFLDVLTDVAMKDDAPAQVKADVQTLMDWFGVKDLDEWRNLSIDEQRAAHEQFARGFEQYLREGEAPSTALEKVFKAFKDWLTKIYKSSEELQVEISPEVRAVYDRLLATDEQIRARKGIETPSLFGGMESEETPANPVVKAVQQTAEQVIDQAPISEDSKARIRETLGINQPEQQTGENHPHYGIPNEEQFMNQNLETSAIDDPNAFIVLDDGREVSMGEYMREVEAEQKQELDKSNSISEAAQCMYRNGAFDDVF
jgi:hypothetical protein|nr:MAG TPA: crystallin beta/gamma motif-containing protein [Caudoviricetes sp.]